MTNVETEPSPLPPPSSAPVEPTERRWARSDDRVVFGVAGGLARALAIEPLFVRVGFVVMALFSGVGILLYLAGLLLLADSPISRPPSMIRRVIGCIVVLISARWLLGGDAHLPGAGWVVAIGLLGIAVALWRGRGPVEATLPPPTLATQTADSGGSTAERWSSWTAQRRQRPRPPRSVLGLLTIGAASVLGAIVWLFNDGAGNRGTLAFGWATIVLGIGLLVGTVAGRARWLIIPALATAAAAVLAAGLNFAGVGLTDHAGGRSLYLGPGSTVAALYRTGVGDVDLWLADYPNDVTTSVEVGAGDVTIVVPDGARVQIDARVGIGTIDALGSTRSGYRRILSLDTDQGNQVIKLRLRVGAGSIEVRRGNGVTDPFLKPPQFLPDIPPLQFFGDGSVLFSDGSVDFGDGRRIEADGTYQIPIVEQRGDGSVRLDNGAIIQLDGTVVSPGGFVIHRLSVRPPVETLPAASTTYLPVTTEVQP